MIELYHLNLKSNIADLESSDEEEPSEFLSPGKVSSFGSNRKGSITGVLAEKRDLTIRELLMGTFRSSKSRYVFNIHSDLTHTIPNNLVKYNKFEGINKQAFIFKYLDTIYLISSI